VVNGVTHRSLDGHRFKLSGDLDLSHPYSSVVRYVVDGVLHELTSGDLDAGRSWAEDIGVTHFDDEFALQGGRLRTGTVSKRDDSVGMTETILAAVWEGRRFSVFTHLYHAKAADAVRMFDVLGITEHDDGITLTSRKPKRAGIAEPADVVKEIPGLGLVEITALNKTTATRLPGWSGTKVHSGELFRDTLDDDSTYFLLATPSAVVTVLPPGEGQLSAVANRIGALTVQTVT
jgi:hypothetical protein